MDKQAGSHFRVVNCSGLWVRSTTVQPPDVLDPGNAQPRRATDSARLRAYVSTTSGASPLVSLSRLRLPSFPGGGTLTSRPSERAARTSCSLLLTASPDTLSLPHSTAPHDVRVSGWSRNLWLRSRGSAICFPPQPRPTRTRVTPHVTRG